MSVYYKVLGWGVVLSLMFEGMLSFLLWREDDN